MCRHSLVELCFCLPFSHSLVNLLHVAGSLTFGYGQPLKNKSCGLYSSQPTSWSGCLEVRDDPGISSVLSYYEYIIKLF